jgi:Ca2+-binding EF-hand superfamily protein
MLKERLTVLSVLIVSLCAATPALAQQKASACHQMKAFDPDNDGTMDLNEAKNAGSKLFDKLDVDKDGTLDQKELGGRITKAQFKAANPDNDGTLDKQEFLKIVEARFNAANPDQDGTIDCKELESAKGKALLRVIAP